MRPIRIVTVEAGGAGDFGARLIAQGLSSTIGEQVIVENRPSGPIPGTIVARAQPDGYTLMFNGPSHWLLPLLQNDVPYDPVKDFAPITLAVISPSILLVHPSINARSVKDLIALAKAKPSALNYGSSGSGSASHLAAELFKSLAGVDIVRVPYKGTGPAIVSVTTGETQLTFAGAGGAAPHIKSGKVRALAVTTAKPSTLYPELPTMAAAGVPGYSSELTQGVFAPRKTPPAIVLRLNQDTVRALRRPDIADLFAKSAVEVVASSPAEFAAALKSDLVKYGKLIKATGMRAD